MVSVLRERNATTKNFDTNESSGTERVQFTDGLDYQESENGHSHQHVE
jgi:hypothetical protein